jgi:hypothetical protein
LIHNEDEQILIHFHNVEFYPHDHDQYDVVYLLILEPIEMKLFEGISRGVPKSKKLGGRRFFQKFVSNID